jgi:hypothetical protein
MIQGSAACLQKRRGFVALAIQGKRYPAFRMTDVVLKMQCDQSIGHGLLRGVPILTL